MKFIQFLLVFIIVISPLAGSNNTFVFDEFMFNNLPGSYFPNFFLENYAPDVILSIEESNGFSHIDNPRVYFEGESYINFNWNYDGFNTNSALDPGRSAVIFPFSTYSGYSLKGHSASVNNSGLHITSTDHTENFSRGIISSVYSNLGSYTPLGPVMIQPEHPSLRDEMLYSTRRGMDNSYFVDYMISRKLFGGNISLAVNHYYIKRNFNDFNEFDEQFSENGNYLIFSMNYKKKTRNGSYEILGGINSLKRDNVYAELGRLPEETIKRDLNSYFTGFKYRGGRLSFLVSYIHENSRQDPVSPDHSLDIFDNDGVDIFAVNRYGIFSSDIFSSELSWSLSKRRKLKVDLYTASRLSILSSDEYTNAQNLLFAGDDPYQVVLWDPGNRYTNNNFNLNSGLRFKLSIGNSSFLTCRLYMGINSISFDKSDNNISFIEPGFDIGFFTSGKSSSFYLSGGRTPGKLRENINHFLESSSLSGSIYSWTDINNDNLYQVGEESGLYRYTGGEYHTVDTDLKNPVTNSLLMLYSKKISTNFVFNLKAIYKQFLNNPWVQSGEEYGFYQNVSGTDLYFIDSSVNNYSLTNSQFEKDPFYAQLILNFTGRVRERWFFSFSFMAHMGMGYTSFGNGPNSNDIGIISESMADPNSWINGYGRLDGDRGFVSKLYFGYFLSKKLFLGVSIKYRDGNPFAFLNREYINDQWILYYDTIQAEDEKGIKGGPREDYVSDISLKLSYSFKLFRKKASLGLSFFNVLDFGSEISEYVFSGGERYSMELQIPKSIRLNLSFEL